MERRGPRRQQPELLAQHVINVLKGWAKWLNSSRCPVYKGNQMVKNIPPKKGLCPPKMVVKWVFFLEGTPQTGGCPFWSPFESQRRGEPPTPKRHTPKCGVACNSQTRVPSTKDTWVHVGSLNGGGLTMLQRGLDTPGFSQPHCLVFGPTRNQMVKWRTKNR